ncbi:mannose-6-phosphate isomerase-like protein (cupin superfamily) [Sphingopyxis sp. OAS728]|uniref:cupin domain-containing protein n=1 Tax=Sphingopyxis sp. OAS728 TaxID=2663823 RepID=UPI0019D9F987|nr:cupin domain-containing protein [Sphingopyxis sp. OAS728]MBE1525672.1 mannose-6-phosphate isomerase-like protein (cupin superfamily) [Sphingopyxis sp. OAS728]
MDDAMRSGVIRLAEYAAQVPTPEGERSVLALKRGTLDVRLSVPVPPNRQTPHEQDELYAVIRGKGVLIHGDERTPFAAGDLLFVAAGVEHHYADFSDDLALWRIFYGKAGGEVAI